MAQQDIKPMSTTNTVRAGGKVRPQEPVKIYAASGKAAAHLGPKGTEHTVHAVLADKLVKKGAATLEKPKEADKKPVTLTKKEIEDLTAALGHEPTAEEIASAIETKKGAAL